MPTTHLNIPASFINGPHQPMKVITMVYDSVNDQFVPGSGGGGGGGGGDASAVNQVTLNNSVGALTDTAWNGVAASASLNALLRVVAGALQPRTLTPSITVATTAGSVAAGSRFVSLVFTAGSSGTILGQAFAAGEGIELATNNGETLAAVAYTVTTGSLRILSMV